MDKAWYMSKGVWGGIIAIGAAVAGAFGYVLDAEAQAGLADAAVVVAGAVGGVLAIVGRVQASKKK
jgi:uncharacterized membrane-anchored protein